MPDVSIIIPVYNIKTLLPRCVASLQAQTWQDFEVWLVDDGSTDGSGLLCDELAVKDARIHVLHKENGGQGLARDLGLDHAQGEYICYVDSDDEVLPNLLEDALRAAREADADIVCYGYYKQPLDGEGNALQRSGPRLPALSGVYTYEEFWKNFRKAKYESMPVVRLYRRDYLQKYSIRFTSLRVGEDAHFLTQLLDAPFRRIVYLRSAYYIYNIRPSSTMTSFQKAYFGDEAAARRAEFDDVVRRHAPTPGEYDDLIGREALCVVLESARKLSFVRDTMPNAERIQWLRKACERPRAAKWLAESRREMADSSWQWVGLCILKGGHYRLALAYFDLIQTLRSGRDRRMKKK